MGARRDFLKAMGSIPFSPIAASTQVLGQDEAPTARTVQISATESSSKIDFELDAEPTRSVSDAIFPDSNPKSWTEISAKVQDALRPLNRSQDVLTWMETFSESFDTKARKIVMAANGQLLHNNDDRKTFRYEPQLYEAALRDAAEKLDRCLRCRQDMGECEIAGINAGISYLTYLRVAPLQLDLIRNSSSADLASMARDNGHAILDIYKNWSSKHNKADSSDVGAHRQDAQSTIDETTLIIKKEHDRATLMEEQFRLQADAQRKRFRRFLSPGSASNYSERYLRALRLLEEDLSDAYCALFSAAQGINNLFNSAVSTIDSFPVGGGKKVKLIIRELAKNEDIESWIDDFAANASPNGTIKNKPDLLDALVLWCRGIMRELDRLSELESEVVVTVSVPIAKDGQTLTTETGTLPQLTLNDDNFPAFMRKKALRVVGFGLSVRRDGTDQKPFPYSLDTTKAWPSQGQAGGLPFANTSAFNYKEQSDEARTVVDFRLARVVATVKTPGQLVNGTTYYRPLAVLTNVRIMGGMSGDLEPEISDSPAFRNFSPFNKEWTITLDQMTLHPASDATPDAANSWSWVSSVVLHLRVRGIF